MYGVVKLSNNKNLNKMKEQIKKALWERVKSTYPSGTSKHTNALLEEDFENFIDEVVKICTITAVVEQSEKCSGCEESTGETKLWCCNYCGKRIEDF